MKLPFLRARGNKITHFLLLSKLTRANVCSHPWIVQQAGAFAHLKALVEQSPFQAQQHPLNYKSIWRSASQG